ncbi:MAG: hypothetical protein ACYC1I_06650 [Acidimicrobiales bacterium]
MGLADSTAARTTHAGVTRNSMRRAARRERLIASANPVATSRASKVSQLRERERTSPVGGGDGD